MTSRVIASLEEGTNHPTLPLGFVSSLAELLVVQVVALYPEARPGSDQGELAAQIGAFLVEAGTLVAAEPSSIR